MQIPKLLPIMRMVPILLKTLMLILIQIPEKPQGLFEPDTIPGLRRESTLSRLKKNFVKVNNRFLGARVQPLKPFQVDAGKRQIASNSSTLA